MHTRTLACPIATDLVDEISDNGQAATVAGSPRRAFCNDQFRLGPNANSDRERNDLFVAPFILLYFVEIRSTLDVWPLISGFRRIRRIPSAFQRFLRGSIFEILPLLARVETS